MKISINLFVLLAVSLALTACVSTYNEHQEAVYGHRPESEKMLDQERNCSNSVYTSGTQPPCR